MKNSMKEQDLYFAEYIVNLIKYNKCLTHLNLSGLGISKEMAELIIPYLRKTTTLSSIHLSGNPCIKTLDIQELRESLHAIEKKRNKFVQPKALMKSNGREEVAVMAQLAQMKRLMNTDIQVNDHIIN